MNGVFAIEKPSGVTSAKFIGKIQAIFTKSDVFAQDLTDARNKTLADLSSNKQWSKQKINSKVQNIKVKIGHGGTLDPLASGILVVGVGNGTKKLQAYLNGSTKTYETKALLGISTTTGDCEGEILTKNPVDHVTKEMVLAIPEKFVGDLKQTPPIFSALKLNGKPLYEYAREGIPLPEAIKVREVKVNSLQIFPDDILSVDHDFIKLESELDENGEPKEHALASNPTLNDSPLYFSKQYMDKLAEDGKELESYKPIMLGDDQELPEKLPMIHFSASVSSGTYIRSLISDIGRALHSSAYMVELIRSKQAEWELGKNVFKIEDFTDRDERIWGPVLKTVLDNGSDVNVGEEFSSICEKVLPLIEKEKEVLDKYAEQSSQEAKDEVNEEAISKKRTIDQVES
jgi:tRNA pseudouridine55 synthase